MHGHQTEGPADTTQGGYTLTLDENVKRTSVRFRSRYDVKATVA
ncbi:hypothetical protein [Streptomyces sp. NPDC005374]